MKKNEKMLLLVLAILLVVFAGIMWYLNVQQSQLAQPSTMIYKPVAAQNEPIKLNNTLKTSVTVLPAPGANQ
jgi:cell division protein FtsL